MFLCGRYPSVYRIYTSIYIVNNRTHEHEMRTVYDCVNGNVRAAWRSGWVTRNVEVVRSSPVVSLSKKLYPHYLVLVGSRNGFERDFTIELK